MLNSDIPSLFFCETKLLQMLVLKLSAWSWIDAALRWIKQFIVSKVVVPVSLQTCTLYIVKVVFGWYFHYLFTTVSTKSVSIMEVEEQYNSRQWHSGTAFPS